MTDFPLGAWALSGIASLTSPSKSVESAWWKLSCPFQGRMDSMPIKNCVFSSGRHICEILSVGVPFLGVQDVKPAVILLLHYLLES